MQRSGLNIEHLAESLVEQLGRIAPRDDGPWWKSSVWQLGPVVVLLFIFVFMMLGWLPSPLTHIGEMQKTLEQHMDGQEKAITLWRTICRNTAKTDMARDKCDE